MEGSSGPEKQWPEPNDKGLPSHPFRPPGLEMMMGLGLFFSAFMVQQMGLLWGFSTHPHVEAAKAEAPLEDVIEALQHHGDVVSWSVGWGGTIGTLTILLFVALWKKKQWRSFLALRTPSLKTALKWMGIFLAFAVVIEIVVSQFEVLQDPFTAEVVSTVTKPFLFILCMGIIGPLFEELAFRGLFYGSLRYLLDKHVTIAIVSGVFTVLHMQYSLAIMFTQVFPLAVLLGYVRSETNSLWPGLLIHILVNSSALFIASA